MDATDVLVMSVASYFVNMYFLGCLRFARKGTNARKKVAVFHNIATRIKS